MQPFNMIKNNNNNVLMHLMIIGLLLLLCGIGIVMQVSAGNGSFKAYALPQLIKAIIGFVLLLIIYFIPTRIIFSITPTVYIICLLMVMLVSLLGIIHLGAQRWLSFGKLAIQPSELMKVSLILILARLLHKVPFGIYGSLYTYFLPFILIMIPFLLIILQPDLGTAVILLTTGIIMFFISGLKLRYFGIAFIVGLIATPIFWLNIYDYQKQRILSFLNPEKDPLGSGYHIIQSKIAIGSGGFWGKGYMNGSQSQLDFIPEKQTDFIFSLFTEEFGFVGALVLLILYSTLIFTSLVLAFKSKSNFSKYFITGFISLLFLHVFINISMVTGLIPIVGVPLPFISFGGTSLVSLMIGFGLLLNFSKDYSIKNVEN